MPLLRIESTIVPAADKQRELLAQLSGVVAQTIGKPEQYVMVTFTGVAAQMSGKPGNAALVDVRSIGGLTSQVNRELSQKICQLLTDFLEISPDRIYLNFTEVEATHWGWNGNTFD